MQNRNQSRSKAVECLVAAAEGGDPHAQHSLASKLATGSDVEMDERAAFFWYCQACLSGLAEAKFNAGVMLINGEGAEVNVALGMHLIEDAAALGENNACMFISFCYARGGYGKAVDEKLAEYWRLKSLEQVDEVFGAVVDVEKMLGVRLNKPLIKFK